MFGENMSGQGSYFSLSMQDSSSGVRQGMKKEQFQTCGRGWKTFPSIPPVPGSRLLSPSSSSPINDSAMVSGLRPLGSDFLKKYWAPSSELQAPSVVESH